MNRINKFSLIGYIFLAIGCTSVPKDNGISDVTNMLIQKGINTDVNESNSSESIVELLISQPITLENAIQLALLNNIELHK